MRIINVARGGLVAEDALLEALDAGKVAGAAIDVFEQEPPPMDNPLLQHPKVIVTPHLGASTAEAQERVASDVAQQVLAVLRGEPATYAVNMPFINAETFKLIAPYLQAATQAGALATQLASAGQLQSVEIEYLGEIAEHETSPLRGAVIRGLLQPVSEENVTLVNASLIAEQRGMKISERSGSYDGIYKDLIRVNLTTSSGKTSVSVTAAHDGPHIVEINDFWVDVSPGEGYLFLCENKDRPGHDRPDRHAAGRAHHQHLVHARGARERRRPRAHGAGPGRPAGRRHPGTHHEHAEHLQRPRRPHIALLTVHCDQHLGQLRRPELGNECDVGGVAAVGDDDAPASRLLCFASKVYHCRRCRPRTRRAGPSAQTVNVSDGHASGDVQRPS